MPVCHDTQVEPDNVQVQSNYFPISMHHRNQFGPFNAVGNGDGAVASPFAVCNFSRTLDLHATRHLRINKQCAGSIQPFIRDNNATNPLVDVSHNKLLNTNTNYILLSSAEE